MYMSRKEPSTQFSSQLAGTIATKRCWIEDPLQPFASFFKGLLSVITQAKLIIDTPLQRNWGLHGGTKWHRFKTVSFTKQTGQFSQKSTPLSNGIGGTDKD